MMEKETKVDFIEQLEALETKLAEKEKKLKSIEKDLARYEAEFTKGQEMIQSLKKVKRMVRTSMRAIPAYFFGRRNVKQVYSRSYKLKAAQNKLKMYKKYLYDYGFEERALSDLLDLYFTTDDHYLKRALAWELGLYYANKLEKRYATLALEFLSVALENEKSPERRRKIAILQAESEELLGHRQAAKKRLTALLKKDKHPDLYIALANVEETPEERLNWLNKALSFYDLQKITCTSDETVDAYYRLTTDPIQRNEMPEEARVSIIIPAYNAESGIRVAIESMLNQTWQSIELLVVDDCSTDATREVIQEYVEKDERVRLLSTPENSGPYLARNIGLKEATGQFVTINDADDWSHPEKIERQVQHLLDHPEVIGNTSAHARLTESLKPYRRSMPGKYIFSNMSSLMFRREPVLEKVGYWDRLRFAADSEFKNRLIAVFGKEALVDLESGPLSFPMQSSSSLTASSKFGYNGFLMGVRKEYAESYRTYHKNTTSFYMPFAPPERLYPVPEPMLPERKKGEVRTFDAILIADFRQELEAYVFRKLETLKNMGMKIGLIQMGKYDLKAKAAIHSTVREVIDGQHIQMLVYGENVKCDLLFIHNPAIFSVKQKYVPHVTPKVVRVMITERPKMNRGKSKFGNYNLRECARHIDDFTKVKAKWYPVDEDLRKDLLENHRRELQSIPLSTANGMNDATWDEDSFKRLIESWIVDENPFELK